MSNVINLHTKRNDLQDLVDRIKDSIYEHEGREFTAIEIVGALEVVKLELFRNVIRMAEEEGG